MSKQWSWAWWRTTEKGPQWILMYVLLNNPGFCNWSIMMVHSMSQWQKNDFNKFALKISCFLPFSSSFTVVPFILLYLFPSPFPLSFFSCHSSQKCGNTNPIPWVFHFVPLTLTTCSTSSSPEMISTATVLFPGKICLLISQIWALSRKLMEYNWDHYH